MDKKIMRPNEMRHTMSQAEQVHSIEEELLELYLALPKNERKGRFTDTAGAAEITGLAQRTIQLWIEIGVVHAVRIGGRKYQVSLDSLNQYLRSRADELTN